MLKYYMRYLPKKTGKRDRWCSAILFIVRNEGVCERSLRESFEKYASVPELKIVTVASTDHALAQIEKIFNFNKKRGRKDFVLDYQLMERKTR